MAGVGVVFVELAVAAPVDRDVELVAGFFVGEAAAQDVEEEAFGEVAVDRRGERVVDRSHERCAFGGLAGEELLVVRMSATTNSRPSSVIWMSAWSTVAKPSRRGAVDEGQEVVDFEHEVVRERGQVFGAAAGEQDLEEAGHAADGRGGERLVDR